MLIWDQRAMALHKKFLWGLCPRALFLHMLQQLVKLHKLLLELINGLCKDSDSNASPSMTHLNSNYRMT